MVTYIQILERIKMRVNRVDIIIPRKLNTHKEYLNNELLSFVRTQKVGGLFTNDFVQLNSVPENLLKILENLKIVFNKL